MISQEQSTKALEFRNLHQGSRILVLPNAWDVCSAKIFETEGFPAVGINIEDGTGCEEKPLMDLSLQVERIQVIREMTRAVAIPLVINVRTDVYLTPHDSPGARLRHALARGRAYLEAGADCVFVPTPLDAPGMLDRKTLITMVKELGGSLNVLGGSVTLPVAELQEIGVARVSLGPGPMRACLARIRTIARELRDQGTYDRFMKETIPYSEVNQWFSGEGRVIQTD